MSTHSLQDVREQRYAIAQQIKALTEMRPFTKAHSDESDRLFAQIEPIDAHIRTVERSITLSNDLEGPSRAISNHFGGSVDENAHRINAARQAFVKALRIGAERLSPEEQALISADAPGNRGRVRNVAEGSPATGGYLVPTILMPSVLTKLKYYGGVRSVANLFPTSSGAPIAWPTMDDTAAIGEIVAENAGASSGDLAFGQVTSTPSKFSSKIVPVSLEVLQDSAADAESVVLDALAIRIARAQNQYFTIGTGINQPQGCLTAASLGYTMPTGGAMSVTYDALVNLYHAVDLAYRQSDRCAFMMHDLTFKAVKLLKDGAGRPIWLPSTSGALGGDQGFDTLLGKRLVINNDLPLMAANAKSILFGDFSKYLVRDVMDVLILRFTDSAYAKFGQVGFLAWARSDGRLIDASNASIQYLQNAAA